MSRSKSKSIVSEERRLRSRRSVENDDKCAICLFNRGVEVRTFAYIVQYYGAPPQEEHWCSWCQCIRTPRKLGPWTPPQSDVFVSLKSIKIA